MSEKARETPEGTNRPLMRAAFFALLVLLVVASIKSYRDLSMARSQEAELLEQIEGTRAQIEVLGETVERIVNDSATLEQLAREELGWVREGDVVIVLPEEERGSGAPGAPSGNAAPGDFEAQGTGGRGGGPSAGSPGASAGPG